LRPVYGSATKGFEEEDRRETKKKKRPEGGGTQKGATSEVNKEPCFKSNSIDDNGERERIYGGGAQPAW